jgi:UDP-N-acetyl-D-mannosaminuronic acid dehydrogenase
MPLTLTDGRVTAWSVRKIGVVGPGIVGMPMAALLADARVRLGTDQPARVHIVQRRSPSSGWKVDAINHGESPIGGVEPSLNDVVRRNVAEGRLSASDDPADLADADVVLVSVQTDRDGFGPDYGPLFGALDGVIAALARRPAGNVPLVVFESTLAPSSMATVIRDRFAAGGLLEGRDVLLGNSPNRVMPGRLVERVRRSDKLVAGLHPATPDLIRQLYAHVVTEATLHPTNSLTAEVVKTLENAYRDVRIAYAAEMVRWCDAHDVDFFALRDGVNERLAQLDAASADPLAVPVGGLLVPTVGVGGHCLPKDGVLLWWRRHESGDHGATSLILGARTVNDESPAATLKLAAALGPIDGRPVALLGTAYRGDSEDTRNSPAFALARLLLARGCDVTFHDPFVRPDDPNLKRFGFAPRFTRDLGAALSRAEVAVVCVAHGEYARAGRALFANAPALRVVVDGCNLAPRDTWEGLPFAVAGIGHGRQAPTAALVDFALAGFQAVERGVAREVSATCDFLNARYAADDFQRVRFSEVQRLAGTCTTGCAIVDALPPEAVAPYEGFLPRLVELALAS